MFVVRCNIPTQLDLLTKLDIFFATVSIDTSSAFDQVALFTHWQYRKFLLRYIFCYNSFKSRFISVIFVFLSTNVSVCINSFIFFSFFSFYLTYKVVCKLICLIQKSTQIIITNPIGSESYCIRKHINYSQQGIKLCMLCFV